MIKKLDRLVLGAYIGPFLVTLPVIIFIFLIQTILKYIDELVGKDIGFASFLELIFYFSLNLLPVALPLAILLGSLIAFGNMGEHNELTAIKSAGISLLRIFRPVFILVFLITVFMYWFNDVIVPKVNLKAYSLLYDLRHKKPALDIREGSFYNGLPGYSIKVTKKYPDGQSLKGLIIYNHTENRGNIQVISADSGKMYTFLNDKYLAIELYNGHDYSEQIDNESNTLHPKKFIRTNFYKSKICFNLTSFDMKKTEEGLFKGNKLMQTGPELQVAIDSIAQVIHVQKYVGILGSTTLFYYTFAKNPVDPKFKKYTFKESDFRLDSLYKNMNAGEKEKVISLATNHARNVKSYIESHRDAGLWIAKEKKGYEIALHQKFTHVLICLLFFIIGAPLGAIIKKGGLGVPMIICIVFFVIYYIISMTCEKWAKENEVSTVAYAIWAPLVVLLPFGLFFLRQAKNDSKVFDMDIYRIYWERWKTYRASKSVKKLDNQNINLIKKNT